MKAEPAPVVVPGGGPAGVVDVPNKEVVGLLVGVVVLAWPADALAPKLGKKLLPVLAPPKRLGFCCSDGVESEGLLGVEKAENPCDGAELIAG